MHILAYFKIKGAQTNKKKDKSYSMIYYSFILFIYFNFSNEQNYLGMVDLD